MQDAITYGDCLWDMRRSLLGRQLKEVMGVTFDYAKFCLKVLIDDKDKYIKKTAILGILEYKNINIDGFALPQHYENMLEDFKSGNSKSMEEAANNLQHIIEN